MSLDPTHIPGDQAEALLTALLLGELPEADAVALRRALEQDARLAALYDRLKLTIDLVRETATSPAEETAAQPAPLKLADERRQKLLAHFKTVAPREFTAPPRRQMSWVVPMSIAAVLVAILGARVLAPGPLLFRARQLSQAAAVENNVRMIEGGKDQWALEHKKSPGATPTPAELADYFKGGALPRSVAGETYQINPVGTPAAAARSGRREKGAVISSSAAPREDVFTYNTSPQRPPPAGPTPVPPSASPPPATPPATAKRTEIVLPSGGQPGNAENAQLETRAFQVDANALMENRGLGRVFPSVELAQNSGGIGGGGGGGGVFDLPRRDAELGVPRGYVAGGFAGAPTTGFAEAGVTAAATLPPAPGLVPPDNSAVAFEVPRFKNEGKSLASAPQNAPALGDVAVLGTQFREADAAGKIVARTPFDLKPAASPPTAGNDLSKFGLAYGNTSGGDNGLKSPAPAPGQEAGKDVALMFDLNRNGRADQPEGGGRAAGQAGVFSGRFIDRLTMTINRAAGTADPAPPPLGEKTEPEAATEGPVRRSVSELNTAETLARQNQPSNADRSLEFRRMLSQRDDTKKEIDRRTGAATAGLEKQKDAGRAKPDPARNSQAARLNEEVKSARAKLEELRSLASEEPDQERAWKSKNLENRGAVVTPESDAPSDSNSAIRKQELELTPNDRQFQLARRELDNLQNVRNAIQLRILQETADAALPTTKNVEIVDAARAEPDQNPSLGQRIARTLTGDVERSARVVVAKEAPDITGLGLPRNSKDYDPFFTQTELEKIRSRRVLDRVIEKLNLNEAWANKHGFGGRLNTDDTYQLLKKCIDVRRVPGTDLIDIQVKSQSPGEAARIANTVAEVYQDTRSELKKELSERENQELQARLAEQDQKIASVKQELARLRLERNQALTNEIAQQEAKIASAKRELERLEPKSNLEPADAARPKPSAPAPVPQPEIQTRENAFSTFSLNVADVSFKLAAASLEKGTLPEPTSVRSEEFINAFDYRDPEPPTGAPIGFAWERARYPFAHNRDLLRFSVKTAAAGRQPGRPLNLVLLLDNSGSMERADRVRIIHEALRLLAAQLQPRDQFSVITFARTAQLRVDGVSGDQAAAVAEQLSGLTPEGGTNLEEAMNLAYQTALRHYLAAGINRVVLLTDGAANLGNVDPETLKQKVEAHRKQGVALDCFGIGWDGYNDDLLEVLSRNGDGRYGFLNTPEEAATEFAGQLAGALHVAASDVKVQVEFNPARVTAYRQVGYAKHQLTKEQFRDNTVDAAEIGAAESGNALYVVEINPAGEGPLAVVRVRYRVPGTADYPEHEWAVPYSGNAPGLEQSGPAMRLAAAASAFSEWLVASPYAAEVSPDRLLGCLAGVPEVYGADARPKKLEWMIRQAKSISGK